MVEKSNEYFTWYSDYSDWSGFADSNRLLKWSWGGVLGLVFSRSVRSKYGDALL